MSRHRLILTSVLMLLGSCLGQERGGTDPGEALPLLRHILGAAKASGSIAYWGRCEASKPYPDFPVLRYPSSDSRSPLELLREVFAKDRNMEVRQESNGLFRMFETDVPMDFLNIKFRHVSFGRHDEDRDIFNGPNDTLDLILSSPEVETYCAAHNIGPFTLERAGSHPAARKQQVSGDLYDVTLKQVLDYILQTFPGFWIYQNCRRNEGDAGRNVYFRFYESDDLVPRNARTDSPLDEKSK
jgi:hypothetical protein